MSTAPIVTIFVRHSAECKYHGDEFYKRCPCRKHLRWSKDSVQHRRQAGTRSWEEAETKKRELEDQLAGRTPDWKDRADRKVHSIPDAVEIFLNDKKVQGVTPGVLSRYTLELTRFRDYCWTAGTYNIENVTRELLTGYAGTWAAKYESTQTQGAVRSRLRGFLRYCYEAEWLSRIPALPKIKIDEPPTMPLSAEEYDHLLDTIPVFKPRFNNGRAPAKNPRAQDGITPEAKKKLHALLELMRWTGLAIGDATTLPKTEIKYNAERDLYSVRTARQKTKTDVYVPIPKRVALELIEVTNGNPKYIFWSGNGQANTIGKTFANRYIRPLFEAAGLDDGSHMVSHRLRDTFAVDLLEKGVPLEEVSKMLGHESIKTTEKSYAKWVKGRQDRLDNLVVGTWA